MSKSEHSKHYTVFGIERPFPWTILAWPLLWLIGWAADKIYKNLELNIVWDDYDEPAEWAQRHAQRVPDPLRVLPKVRADD